MKRLLGADRVGGRIYRYWLHYGDDGREKVTVETVQDVEPVLSHVERLNDAKQGKEFRFKATVTFTDIDRVSKEKAEYWGVTVKQAFEELMQGKTTRAQRALRDLTEGRDYRKLQAEKRNSRYVRMA